MLNDLQTASGKRKDIQERYIKLKLTVYHWDI